jgi:putative transposase
MKAKRFTDAQIVGILHEASGSGNAREVCRKHGIAETTLYRRRAKSGGMQQAEVKRLKQLEDENRRLKRLVADLSLDVAMLKDVAGRSW